MSYLNEFMNVKTTFRQFKRKEKRKLKKFTSTFEFEFHHGKKFECKEKIRL